VGGLLLGGSGIYYADSAIYFSDWGGCAEPRGLYVYVICVLGVLVLLFECVVGVVVGCLGVGCGLLCCCFFVF